MPTLEWIGKEKVINHHQDVPYRVLDKKYTYNGDTSENMIIHGDNLLALKSLLPKYEGRIDCIYIDPPYNTGAKEGQWVYSDNVDDPRIKKWLGEVVGAEGEDLSRHDKWLCMMYPRLKLLFKLLSDEGVIFISIDDNEMASLKLVCDEIFGKNMVCTLVWTTKAEAKGIPPVKMCVTNQEYILAYSKTNNYKFIGDLRNIEDGFRNPDNDPRGPWKRQYLQRFGQGFSEKTIVNPENGMSFTFETPYTEEKMKQWIEEKIIIFPEDPAKYPARKEFFYQYENPYKPIVTSLGLYKTKVNSEKLKAIFDGKKVFDYSKPVDLIFDLLKKSTRNDFLILDSFAGSGTTAHAVLNLNKQDGGNRKFILVEMMDYAETITAERVKRVIKGYGEGDQAVEGTGGDFSYYELGLPLFDETNNLNEDVGIEEIRKYVYYMETKDAISENDTDNEFFLGQHNGTAYYFYYDRENITTLNREFLSSIQTKATDYVIYADVCALPKEVLKEHGITFKKIPRDISRL